MRTRPPRRADDRGSARDSSPAIARTGAASGGPGTHRPRPRCRRCRRSRRRSPRDGPTTRSGRAGNRTATTRRGGRLTPRVPGVGPFDDAESLYRVHPFSHGRAYVCETIWFPQPLQMIGHHPQGLRISRCIFPIDGRLRPCTPDRSPGRSTFSRVARRR